MNPTSIKFPPDMREEAERVAQTYGLSFNAFVRMAVAREIRRMKAPRRRLTVAA